MTCCGRLSVTAVHLCLSGSLPGSLPFLSPPNHHRPASLLLRPSLSPVWGPYNLASFRFIPEHLRVLCGNCAGGLRQCFVLLCPGIQPAGPPAAALVDELGRRSPQCAPPQLSHAAGIAWGCYMSVSCINQAPSATCAAAVAATAALQSSQAQE